MDEIPAAAMAAPAIDPISAWEELLGIPKYHVIRFHAMAATSAASITIAPLGIELRFTISFAMVFATVVSTFSAKE